MSNSLDDLIFRTIFDSKPAESKFIKYCKGEAPTYRERNKKIIDLSKVTTDVVSEYENDDSYIKGKIGGHLVSYTKYEDKTYTFDRFKPDDIIKDVNQLIKDKDEAKEELVKVRKELSEARIKITEHEKDINNLKCRNTIDRSEIETKRSQCKWLSGIIIGVIVYQVLRLFL